MFDTKILVDSVFVLLCTSKCIHLCRRFDFQWLHFHQFYCFYWETYLSIDYLAKSHRPKPQQSFNYNNKHISKPIYHQQHIFLSAHRCSIENLKAPHGKKNIVLQNCTVIFFTDVCRIMPPKISIVRNVTVLLTDFF